jgi:hypothetical protein
MIKTSQRSCSIVVKPTYIDIIPWKFLNNRTYIVLYFVDIYIFSNLKDKEDHVIKS